jgi:mannosyltransferase OCH1-like enzyme
MGATVLNLLWMGTNTHVRYWLQRADIDQSPFHPTLASSLNKSSRAFTTPSRDSNSGNSRFLYDHVPAGDSTSQTSDMRHAASDSIASTGTNFSGGIRSHDPTSAISKSTEHQHGGDHVKPLRLLPLNVSRLDSIPSSRGSSKEDRHPLLQDLTRNPPGGSLICPSAYMAPIYDKIVEESPGSHDNKGHRKIPRIIHVSFNQRCVAHDMAKSVDKWQRALPDHSLYFHDDDAVDRLLNLEWPEFPDLHELLACVQFKGAMKIDVWRILVLYRYGGLYTDIDNWPGQEFTPETIRPEDTFFSLSDSLDRPSQWLFGMEPGHPIGSLAMSEISRRIKRVRNIAKPAVVQITGPQALKRAYMSFMSPTMSDKDQRSKVRKINRSESGNYAAGNLGGTFNDRVEFNGVNMTVREKTELIGGIIHWTKQVKNNTLPYQGSCLDYLAFLNGQNSNSLANDSVKD